MSRAPVASQTDFPGSRLVEWISDPADLRTRLSTVSSRVGLDTEFIRERTWWPQLALVQLAIEGKDPLAPAEILLVDPLVPGLCAVLAELLADASIRKVMHSASEDLIALKHACGVVPTPLFDTQIAAALAGVGAGIGYQRLVQDSLGVALDKGETRSDWMRRPLSASQLKYAAEDVEYLFELHDRLDARLLELDRRDWLLEDCARLVRNAQNDDLDPWPHLGVRAAQYLDRDGQIRLLRLLRWRDTYARDNDRPRSWILDPEFAVALARTPPADLPALQARLDAEPKAPRTLAEVIWSALRTPLPDEASAPAVRSDESDKNGLRKLQQAVATRSAELGLPDGVLASRRWLQPLLDGKEWPGPLSGWRRVQLEPALAPLLTRTGDSGKPSV
jgi:ribonuclease D